MKRFINIIRKKFSNYQNKTIKLILVLTLIPFSCISLLFFVYAYNDYREKTIFQLQNNLNENVKYVDNIYYVNMQNTMHLKYSTNVKYVLTSDKNENFPEIFTYYNDLRNLLVFLHSTSHSDIIKIYSYNPNCFLNEFVVDINNLNSDTKNEMEQINDAVSIWKYVEYNNIGYMALYSKITLQNNIIGISETAISIEKIKSFIQFDYLEEFLISYGRTNGEENLIVTKNFSKENSENYIDEIKKSNKYISLENKMTNAPYKFVLFIDKYIIFKQFIGFLIMYGLFFVAIFIAIIMAVRHSSIKITSHVYNLIEILSKEVGGLKKEDPSTDLSSQDNDLLLLENKIRNLLQTAKEYYDNIEQYKLNEKRLEIELLQQNISPHFLYNSLSAIRWLYPDEKLSAMISEMVKVYRIWLNKGNNILTVKEEVEMIGSYINVQNYAYKFNLNFIADIDEEILNCKILKLLLQPIAENSLLHGINGLDRGGVLKIAAKKVDNNIQFDITDNGVGMPSEKAKNILRQNNNGDTEGYGLINVLNRIKKYYGCKYGMNITSEINVGTNVTIIIPFVE